MGAVAVFAVKFRSVLWYLAMWVDQKLVRSMYPDANLFCASFFNPGEQDGKRRLLNTIAMRLYIGLPLLWSGIMDWAGMHLGGRFRGLQRGPGCRARRRRLGQVGAWNGNGGRSEGDEEIASHGGGVSEPEGWYGRFARSASGARSERSERRRQGSKRKSSVARLQRRARPRSGSPNGLVRG